MTAYAAHFMVFTLMKRGSVQARKSIKLADLMALISLLFRIVPVKAVLKFLFKDKITALKTYTYDKQLYTLK